MNRQVRWFRKWSCCLWWSESDPGTDMVEGRRELNPASFLCPPHIGTRHTCGAQNYIRQNTHTHKRKNTVFLKGKYIHYATHISPKNLSPYIVWLWRQYGCPIKKPNYPRPLPSFLISGQWLSNCSHHYHGPQLASLASVFPPKECVPKKWEKATCIYCW